MIVLRHGGRKRVSMEPPSDPAVACRTLVRPFMPTSAHQLPAEKRTSHRNFGECLFPISRLGWWRDTIRLMINPNSRDQPYKLSRQTAIAFNLDPGAYSVLPHTRIESDARRNAGQVLARLLV